MSDATEAKREALELKLARVLRDGAFPTMEGVAKFNRTVAGLEAEIELLGPKPEPVVPKGTWTFDGRQSTVVRDTSFGTRFERPEELSADDSRHVTNYEPMLREFGEDIT